MKRKWMAILCLVMICCLLPLSAMADWEEGTVVYITSKTRVNVYSRASRTGKLLGETESRHCYAYIDKSGDWYEIWFTDTVRGFVPAKYSSVRRGYVWKESGGDVGAVVLNDNKNNHYDLAIRSDPYIDTYNTIGYMPYGTILPYEGEVDGWTRVWYNGQYGYVASNRSTVITGSMSIIEE